MKSRPLLGDAAILIPEFHNDSRGYFAELYVGKGMEVAQVNVSFNRLAGTIRGLHFQRPPASEVKLVRCISGGIFDVVVELATGRWASAILRGGTQEQVYVPKGFAHGFQTLAHDTEVMYMTSHRYAPELASGIIWNDPALGIKWPIPVACISDRDLNLPRWRSDDY